MRPRNQARSIPWCGAGIAAGIGTWVIPCAVAGVREPWDWSVVGFVLANAGVGLVLGLASRRVLVIALGVASAHFVLGIIGSGSGAAIFPGSIVVGLLSALPAGIGAALGRYCIKSESNGPAP